MSNNFGNETLPYITVVNFTEDSVVAFKEQFFRLEMSDIPIITIYISSFGGDIYAMDSMRDLIKSSNKPVATVALGKAMSAGLFLLAAGTKGYRFSAPNASIMFHEVRGGGGGKVSEYTMEAKEMEKMHNRLFINFAEDTGKTGEFWHKKNAENMNRDLYLTAEESKELGIIDWVYLPRIGIQPHQYYLTMPEEFQPEEDGRELTEEEYNSMRESNHIIDDLINQAKNSKKSKKTAKKPVKKKKK